MHHQQQVVLRKSTTPASDRVALEENGGYLSFSVLAVSIILIVGFLFIVAALILDTAVGFFRRLDWNDHKPLE